MNVLMNKLPRIPLRPLWSALSRHRLIVFLLATEVALACAIACNVLYLVIDGLHLLNQPTGVQEDRVVLIHSRNFRPVDDIVARHQRDLSLLREVPGVESAVAVDALPLSGSNWANGVSTDRNGSHHTMVSAYNGSPGELQTLGLQLVAGRDFAADEYLPMDAGHGYSGIDHVTAAIISRALAQRLFDGQDAIGQLIYMGDTPTTVVGVVDTLAPPTLPGQGGFAMLSPMVPDERDVTYAVRTTPQQADAVLAAATHALGVADQDRVIDRAERYSDLRQRRLHGLRGQISTLLIMSLCLSAVTAVGIFGLASYWVQ